MTQRIYSKSRTRTNRKHRRSNKNLINKTVEQGVSVAKSTSKKYMPKVKSGLENVGSNVVKTSKKSVPYLQNITRKVFGLISSKTKKIINNK